MSQMPKEPKHTNECQDQNLLTWQCICNFSERREQYIDALRAYAEGLEKDAMRYRKARTMPLVLDYSRITPSRPDKFDAIIDAAMKGAERE